MVLVFAITAVVVLVVVAYLATGRGGGLAPLPDETTRLALPERPLTPSDLRDIRLGKAVSGYRVDQVDLLVDRMAGDLAARDARISELERKLRFERLAKGTPLPTRAADTDQPAADEGQPRASPATAAEHRDDSPADQSRTVT